jgi:hypothetical protein
MHTLPSPGCFSLCGGCFPVCNRHCGSISELLEADDLPVANSKNVGPVTFKLLASCPHTK